LFKDTGITTLPPNLDPDGPLPRCTSPLGPALAVSVHKDGSLNTPTVPTLLVDIATFPKHVSVPIPNGMLMDLPEAAVSSPPSIVTATLLVLPSPKLRPKLPLLQVH
jgi:hypothetical protein